ncbi:MAG: tetratricopeptide repeat protein [Phycisphaerales bacterium]|nr:MAG: tetratricopeptide repeat protein [Phycisphaerales bacterium]
MFAKEGSAGGCHASWSGIWSIVLVMGVGASIRLVHVIDTWNVPTVRHLVGDAAGYHAWALRIVGGEWIGSEPFYQAPLYPYVLALWYWVLGESVGAVRIIQALLGTWAAGLLCVSTWRLFGRSTGLVAGVMLALYAPAFFFDGIIQKTSLGCFLTCLLLAGMTWRGGRWWSAVTLVSGIVVALLVLTRENALVWVPILLIWVAVTGWGEDRGKCVRGLGTYVLGGALILGVVGVRNRAVSGEWSISTFQAGPNFYIGNHVGASGLYEPLIRGHETPVFERDDATMLAEQATGRSMSAKEVSDYWMGQALAEIRSDVTGWLGLVGRKALLVFNRYEVADAESQYVYSDDSRILAVVGPIWQLGVLGPLAMAGVVITRKEWRELWVYYALIVSMAGSVALFYVTARYRFPLVPLLIPFAAVGVTKIWESIRNRQGRVVIGAILAALGTAMVVNRSMLEEERLDAMAYMNVGVALAQGGEVEPATVYFRRAVEVNPRSAEPNNNLAMALAIQGDYEGAVAHYRMALAADATLVGVAYNLGVALERLGRVGEALEQYQRAVELDRGDVEAKRAVARLGETR